MSLNFKKRGLPHAHILIILTEEYRLRNAQDVDMVVSAEIPPNPEDFPVDSLQHEQATLLQQLVLKHMTHGPCGSVNPSSPCMKDGKCSKGFPKKFQQETVWDESQTYPLYRRRKVSEGGRQMINNGRIIDNSWIVPYSPYVLLSQQCHNNVEVCCSTMSVKYLFKYVHKGSDRAMVHIEHESLPNEPRNEIKEYQDLRSIGSSEACWKLFDFVSSGRFPAVRALRVHLPEQQMVYIEAESTFYRSRRSFGSFHFGGKF